MQLQSPHSNPQTKRVSLISSYSLERILDPPDEPIDTSDMRLIEDILKIDPQCRSHRHIRTLLEFTKEIAFFKKLTEENSSEAHVKCCQFMQYEVKSADETVFDYGEKGNKFYIILNGSVRVLVPSKNEEGVYDQVNLLGIGASFGELALTKNMPRAARIICEVDTHFATLHKLDFKTILGKLTEQTLNSRVAFLQDLPVFNFWTKKSLVKLSYYFRELRFSRKQVVFRQGDLGEELYFIKEGEFQLNKAIKQESDKKLLLFKPHKVQLNAQVALLGIGEFFGDDDVIANRPRSTTCVCQSGAGTLLAISKEHFLQRLSNTDITSYLKFRNETKDWSRTKRIENFSSLIKTGHLASESPTVSQVSSPKTDLHRRPNSRLMSARHSQASTDEAKDSSILNQLINSSRNSPSHSPTARQSSCFAKTGSLDKLNLRTDVPISVLSLTQRLYKPQKARAKTPQLKQVVNIHTKRVKASFMKAQTARGMLREGLRLPLSNGRFTPTQPSSRSSRRAVVAPISVKRFEVCEEDYSTPEMVRPAKRLTSTRHSMFRVFMKA
mmetsp:Transcript_10120/g.19876  ORF Transcript_10120/g.19876 Transcript_10120/m.19876 type:complete len:554 (+) Transcript_10120:24-1685(+)